MTHSKDSIQIPNQQMDTLGQKYVCKHIKVVVIGEDAGCRIHLN